MDNKTRYDLMVKLSDFYVKNVQKNLDGYNKARFIANTAKFIFFSLFMLFPLAFGFAFIFKDDDIFVAKLLLLTMIIMFAGFFAIAKLGEMDKKNIIQVFKNNTKGSTLPTSADEEIKKHLMPEFLQIFGDFSWSKGYKGNNWKNKQFINSLRILNNPLSMIDDCISGVYNGINVKIFDANTSIRSIELLALAVFLTVWLGAVCFILLPVFLLIIVIFLIMHFTSKGFNGVIVELDMNKKFEGHTFILEKDNIKDNLAAKTDSYEKINLEDPEFSQEFCVYSQNQIEARYILTTAFMERLKKLKEIYKAEYIRAAFKDEKIIIMIQTGRDMFQMAGNSQMTKETFIQLFDEITSVLDIIDILKLNEKLGL